MKTYPSVSSLIPHRPPMLLVDQILDVGETSGVATATIAPDHLFLRVDGTLAPETYCELIAQGFGVCESFRRVQKGLTIDGGGFLASMREMQFLAPARAGDELRIKTTKVDECFDTYIVRGEVYRQDTLLAQGTIYIFIWRGEIPSQKL